MSERSRVPRPLVAIAALAIVVIVATGVTIALGGGVPGGGGTPPSPTTGRPAVGTSGPTAASRPSPSSSAHSDGSFVAGSGSGLPAGRIQIGRLGIDLPIIEGDGVDAPLDKAAHYAGTGWPGGGTNIYIYAHARPGLFMSLWNAVVGDQVDLTLEDGSKRSYVVDQVLPSVPWDAVEYLQPTAAEQLTLQTSTAPDETAPRFVVIAHPSP